MYDENTHVYIFAAPISYGYVPHENLIKVCDSDTEEHRLFMSGALSYERYKLKEDQITILTPTDWLTGRKISPYITSSSEECDAVSKRAKEYLVYTGIVENIEELSALNDVISLNEYYRIIYIVYFIDTSSKKVIKKG